MSRDHVVSIRLTDAERAALERMGSPSDVIRRLLRDAARPARQHVIPITTAPIAPGYAVWMDGVVGQSWPWVATG